MKHRRRVNQVLQIDHKLNALCHNDNLQDFILCLPFRSEDAQRPSLLKCLFHKQSHSRARISNANWPKTSKKQKSTQLSARSLGKRGGWDFSYDFRQMRLHQPRPAAVRPKQIP